MKKFLLSFAVLGLALSASAQDETVYNFFDPADCDSDGWLWLDTQAKLDKYVGTKIILVPAQYEVEDPEFPGEYITPETYVDANVLGYNTAGVAGGEGSKIGGIVLPRAEEGWYANLEGGGILLAMPDCASVDLYVSSPIATVYTCIYAALKETDDPLDCKYIWDCGYDWSTEQDYPVTREYCGYDMNLQDHVYEYTDPETMEDTPWSIKGEKGNPRTGVIYNYNEEEGAVLYVQGIRVFTYTQTEYPENPEEDYVKGVANDNVKVSVNGKCVNATAPVEINVYDICGAKVASAVASSLDCSGLNGVYVVKAAGKSLKVIF